MYRTHAKPLDKHNDDQIPDITYGRILAAQIETSYKHFEWILAWKWIDLSQIMIYNMHINI